MLLQLQKARPRIKHPGQRNHSYLSGMKYLLTVKKASPLRINYWAMNAQFCYDTQYCCWNKSQSANEYEVQFSSLSSMCLADDDLVGSQLSPGTPSSLPRDKIVSNPLSLYSSFLAFQAQHASSGHDKLGTQKLPG